MPYSEPTNLGIIACPGGAAFADEVITHLRHMYKHRFTLKNDVISNKINKGIRIQAEMKASFEFPVHTGSS